MTGRRTIESSVISQASAPVGTSSEAIPSVPSAGYAQRDITRWRIWYERPMVEPVLVADAGRAMSTDFYFGLWLGLALGIAYGLFLFL